MRWPPPPSVAAARPGNPLGSRTRVVSRRPKSAARICSLWGPCDANLALVAHQTRMARRTLGLLALLLCAGGCLARPAASGSPGAERTLLEDGQAPWVRAHVPPLAPSPLLAPPPRLLAQNALQVPMKHWACGRSPAATESVALPPPAGGSATPPAAATAAPAGGPCSRPQRAPAPPAVVGVCIQRPRSKQGSRDGLPAASLDLQVSPSDLRECGDVLKDSLSPPPHAIAAAVFAARGLENYTCSE